MSSGARPLVAARSFSFVAVSAVTCTPNRYCAASETEGASFQA
jgi:hypothetical protein